MQRESIQIICIYRNQKEGKIIKTLDNLVNSIKKNNISLVIFFLASIATCKEELEIQNNEWQKLKKIYQGKFNLDVAHISKDTSACDTRQYLASNSQATYLLFLNIEAIVNIQYFKYLFEVVHREKKIAVVEAKQLPIKSQKEFDRVIFETPCVIGGAIFVCRKEFNQCGGLDAIHFLNVGWDVDMSWRIRLNGYRICYQLFVSYILHQKAYVNIISEMEAEERYRGIMATILMAYKWSYNGLVDSYIEMFKESSKEYGKRYIKTFFRMKKEGNLQVQIDKNHEIAKFYERTGYTKFRYII